MIFDLLMSLAGRYHGRSCRVCSDAIQRHDHFGMSEAVCRSCAR
jgi:hypothetical protein